MVNEKKDKYILVFAGNMTTVAEYINQYISSGYIPQGGICYAEGVFVQAMIFEEASNE